MPEEHLELYKRYRPSQWEDLIGQQAVARSLQSAVIKGKLPTAFMFSGPRGTGKTSAALLLAKAINCLDLQKNGNPCNQCEVCINIDSGSQLGVTYFSAANRSGVDDVRELVLQARTRQPVNRQVFIIDEVHNYTGGKGFEALLIPLEEKNMPSLFILCTTEIGKVKQTLLSRTQQRRFNLIDSTEMLTYVESIAERESLALSPDNLMEAVRLGRGSARDTLSALDAIASTGAAEESHSGKFLEAVTSRNLTKALEVIAHANSAGERSRDLAEQLFEDLRDLLLTASKVDPSMIGMLPIVDTQAAIKNILGKRGILVAMDELGKSITQMTFGADERINLEIFVVNCVTKLKALEKSMAKLHSA
jgi:DNA polymerase-3 subunit gamma/tau